MLLQPASTLPTSGQLTVVGKDGVQGLICPLKNTSVSADIAGFVARVTVTQEFVNPSAEPVEAIYTFPLPEDAAVDDMTMRIGRRVVRGTVRERDEARAIYEAAKQQGRAAALLDQERPNIFTQSVANIMPGQNVKITISYVNLLKYEEGQYEFVFPMVVGPRYIPAGTDTSDHAATVRDPDKITPPTMPPGQRAGHDITLTVNVDAGLPLTRLTSKLHEVVTRRMSPTRAVVTLAKKSEIPNQDFILNYSAAGSDIQSGVLTHATSGKAGYFTLVIQPPNEPHQGMITPKEMIFVIDQSGSQSGYPIEKAKETMRWCLKNMNPNDTFNLIGFSNEPNRLFDAPVGNTPENLDKAMKFLDGINARGGTELLKALVNALEIPDDPERLRIICFMTDGYVGNEFQILDELRKKRRDARLFSFGIGNSVNRFLLDGMAREGKGQVEYVTLNTPGNEPAERFYRRIAKPLLTDIRVNWNGLPVEDLYPTGIPDVFSARPVILKGRYTAPSRGVIEIVGKLRGMPWSQKLTVTLSASDKDGAAIATLWAREKLDDLSRQDYAGQHNGKPDPAIKQQMIATALEYRLMSAHTSFVAVEERIVNAGGKQRTLEVPLEMPAGVTMGLEQELYYAQPAAHNAARSLGRPVIPGGGFGGGGAQPGRTKSGSVLGAPVVLSSDAAGKPFAEISVDDAKAQKLASKLHGSLYKLAERVKKDGKGGNLKVAGKFEVINGRIEVNVTLNKTGPETMKALAALGFKAQFQEASLKLAVGVIGVDKLDELALLDVVEFVEPPRYK